MGMIGHSLGTLLGLPPSPQVASTVNGAAFDRPGSCVVVVLTGAATGTPTSFTVDVKVQDSADGTSGWADVEGAVVPTIEAINTKAKLDLDLGGSASKPFRRLVSVVAFVGGTAPTIQVAAVIVTGGATTFPV